MNDDRACLLDRETTVSWFDRLHLPWDRAAGRYHESLLTFYFPRVVIPVPPLL